jgi:hypothetical protein
MAARARHLTPLSCGIQAQEVLRADLQLPPRRSTNNPHSLERPVVNTSGFSYIRNLAHEKANIAGHSLIAWVCFVFFLLTNDKNTL